MDEYESTEVEHDQWCVGGLNRWPAQDKGQNCLCDGPCCTDYNLNKCKCSKCAGINCTHEGFLHKDPHTMDDTGFCFSHWRHCEY